MATQPAENHEGTTMYDKIAQPVDVRASINVLSAAVLDLEGSIKDIRDLLNTILRTQEQVLRQLGCDAQRHPVYKTPTLFRRTGPPVDLVRAPTTPH